MDQLSTSNAELKKVFNDFCSFGKSSKQAQAAMDGRTLTKLTKQAKLLDGNLKLVDIDLMFAKSKTKGHRSITYKQFKGTLGLMAKKKKISEAEIFEMVINSGRPHSSGTKAQKVKFYDDKSQYTGTWANGGPDKFSKGGKSGLANLLDRSEADVRGRKKMKK